MPNTHIQTRTRRRSPPSSLSLPPPSLDLYHQPLLLPPPLYSPLPPHSTLAKSAALLTALPPPLPSLTPQRVPHLPRPCSPTQKTVIPSALPPCLAPALTITHPHFSPPPLPPLRVPTHWSLVLVERRASRSLTLSHFARTPRLTHALFSLPALRPPPSPRASCAKKQIGSVTGTHTRRRKGAAAT